MAEGNMNERLFSNNDPELDLDIKVDISFSRKDHPEGKMVPITVEGKEEYILIPLNIKDGTTIEISGRGKHNPRSGKTGKLIVEIHIKETEYPWKKWGLLVASVVVVAVVFFILGKQFSTIKGPEETMCPHVWTAADCISPKTCSNCGETSGGPTGHEWIAATCILPKTCSNCGETSGDPAGHEWITATCISPKTCSICGDTSGAALGHQWMEATYASPKTCSVCQATDGESLQNPYTEIIYEKIPILTYAISGEEKIYGYEDSALTVKSNHYYFRQATDELVITNISKDGNALEVRYPSSLTQSGYRTLWFPVDAIIDLEKVEISSEAAKDKTETFRYSQSNEQFMHYGTMDIGNNYIVLGTNQSGYRAIIYSINSKTKYDIKIGSKLALIQ